MVRETLGDLETPSYLSHKNLSKDDLIKIEWLVVNAIAAGSLARANHDFIG